MIQQTPMEAKLTALFEPAIRGRGYRLVCVRMVNEGQGPTLQIMAENPQTRKLGVDECAVISRELSTLLEVEDPIKSAYRLEISSPGIDRPLVNMQDFADFSGFEAKIEINPPQNGQKRFRGRIKGAGDGLITVETDQGPVALPFASVCKAKLVMTEELIKNTGKQTN